jgi:hypothetical protein
MKEHYSFSIDGENYSGFYDSREEAILDAFASFEDREIIHTGRNVVPDRRVCADSVIEQVALHTTEESGDWSDGYLCGVSKEATQELEEELQKVWDKWEKKHQLEPTWYNVTDAQEHQREGTMTNDFNKQKKKE